MTCSHLIGVRNDPKPRSGCRACLARGDEWVHLRQCVTCGEVGCCDDSKNRHASRHARMDGHEAARSLEPGEMWVWCYRHEDAVELDGPETWET